MNILLAVDGSENSHRAAEKALDLAKNCKARITIISVLSQFSPSLLELSKERFYEKLVESHKRYNEDILERYINFFKENGVEAAILPKFGSPAEEIINEAEKGNYWFLIIGSRGLSNVKRAIMGSVSYNVVQHVEIPVLVVK